MRISAASPRLRALIALLAVVSVACGASPSPSASGSADVPGTSDAAPPSSGPSPSASAPLPSAEPGTAEPSGPTSADLITAAMNAGTIDPQTAMRYRVYAQFGAPDLPAEFRSDAWAEDNALLDLAESRLDKLSPETADAIRPFLVRPTDPSSVFFDAPPEAAVRLASAVSQGPLTAALTCTHGWASATGQNNFRVWGRCGPGFNDGDLESVAGWVDTLWEAEATYLGRQPIPDNGGPDEGGDRAVDFYLVTACRTRAGSCQSHTGLAVTRVAPPFGGPAGAYNGSGWVVMNRAHVSDPEGPATVAHELFHVFQNAFNWDGPGNGGVNHWFVEASATWAEYRFVGVPTSTPDRFAIYQGTPHALQDTTPDLNPYRSFVWPLFMEQEGGDGTVAAAWAAIQGQTTFEQVTDAVDAQLSFKSHFRDFAVRDWNAEDLAGVIGPLFPAGAVGATRIPPLSPRLGADLTLAANQPLTPPTSIQASIRSLSVLYKRLTVNADVGLVRLDFAGLSPKDSVDIDLLVKIDGQGWKREQVHDERIEFCRTVPAQRVTQIIVVLANHDKDPDSKVIGGWTAASFEARCPEATDFHVVLAGVLPGAGTYSGSTIISCVATPDGLGGEFWTVAARPDPATGVTHITISEDAAGLVHVAVEATSQTEFNPWAASNRGINQTASVTITEQSGLMTFVASGSLTYQDGSGYTVDVRLSCWPLV